MEKNCLNADLFFSSFTYKEWIFWQPMMIHFRIEQLVEQFFEVKSEVQLCFYSLCFQSQVCAWDHKWVMSLNLAVGAGKSNTEASIEHYTAQSWLRFISGTESPTTSNKKKFSINFWTNNIKHILTNIYFWENS